ncbi:hypothetical protein A176_001951 [Myxococcus hansupus]|uniref:DUF2314 domain-containing protein n=1 Tax=Pseudomyxococcus hansupus TaxID=1297742 RepID=A0A0H4WQK2_9BACT|nr:hypothetical protein A176_001951 [Myxococcus hansupus]
MVWAEEDAVRIAAWRGHPRMEGRFHEEAADDIQAFFQHPESNDPMHNEVMWVTVIAHDAASDSFLGILLNAPRHLKDVQEGDNVVIHLPAEAELPFARDAGKGRLGWPVAAAGSFSETLIRGVRSYRQGRFGHHPPGIQACIETLGPVLEPAPQSEPANLRALGHFVLARCLAEQYETVRAIHHFEQVLRLTPEDEYARLGLLAELSLLAHMRQDALPSGTEQEWESRYLAQVAVARERLQNRQALELLDVIFSQQEIESGDELTPEQLEKRRRVGAGAFRYKAR